VLDNAIEPSWFSQGLISGGPTNGNRVTAVWFKNGGRFIDTGGANILYPVFRQ
jgi:hypothetical protein